MGTNLCISLRQLRKLSPSEEMSVEYFNSSSEGARGLVVGYEQSVGSGLKPNLFRSLCSNFAPEEPVNVFEKQLQIELFVHKFKPWLF